MAESMHCKKTTFRKDLCFIGHLLLIITVFLHLTACGPKQAPYFQGNFDTTRYAEIHIPEIAIQKGDILSITVFSDDPTASAIYNQPVVNVGTSAGQMGGNTAGYLVDEDGNIQFQALGRLHVEGLSKSALIELLNKKLSTELKNPYYTIRFLNYKITVQGEVNRGGTFMVPNERVTILEALALAGDLTVYAKRNDVLIIREKNGRRELGRADITKPDLFNSPYYYLRQNDMVIVEPTRKKPSAGDQQVQRNVGIITAVVSTLAVVYSILRR